MIMMMRRMVMDTRMMVMVMATIGEKRAVKW